MKRYSLTSFILCFYLVIWHHTGNTQDQEWINLNPSFDQPGNYNMSLGVFVDEENGWFTEMFPGRTWRTQDGGLSWNMQVDSSAVWSYNIEFLNCNYGWILGKRIIDYFPFLKRTKNGGESWETFSLPGELVAINFLDTLTGYSGGESAIYRTTDGGESWQAQTIETGARFEIWDIFFINGQFGWAVGHRSDVTDTGIILNTIDSGKTWQANVEEACATGMGVYFTGRLHGYVVGSNPPFFEGVIMRTKDGGGNWEIQYLPCTWLNDLVFTDDSTGWVVGDYGFIWYTEDGGETWEKVESGTDADLSRIVFVENGNVGYIFGEDNTLLRCDRTGNDVKEDDPIFPAIFRLYQNYPNPFNSQTVIKYELEKTANVILKVYNLMGKEVVTLMNLKQITGSYKAVWNGSDKYGKKVSSGIYFCQLIAGPYSQVRKMILSR